jgi:hypothetical protein
MSPYIAGEKRPDKDQLIDQLIEILRDDPKIDGSVNYVITRIVAGSLRPDTGWSYTIASDAVKAFECAKLEFYDRILKPLELDARKRNGDIREYRIADEDHQT